MITIINTNGPNNIIQYNGSTDYTEKFDKSYFPELSLKFLLAQYHLIISPVKCPACYYNYRFSE